MMKPTEALKFVAENSPVEQVPPDKADAVAKCVAMAWVRETDTGHVATARGKLVLGAIAVSEGRNSLSQVTDEISQLANKRAEGKVAP